MKRVVLQTYSNVIDQSGPQIFPCACQHYRCHPCNISLSVAVQDYSSVQTTFTFPPGSVSGPASRQCLNAFIAEDNIFEKDEIFTLNIVSTSDNVVSHIATFFVNIHDDDGK